MRKGIWYAVVAYTIWGFFPIYWKWLEAIPALQVVAHRILWSCVVLAGLILASNDWAGFRAAIKSPWTIAIYAAAALAIAINWFVYIWAVSAGFIVQTALGYFINPLVSVLMGVMILREHLRPRQWMAISLAAAGVLYLTIYYGTPPWIALTLAASFGTYGLLKKTAPLGPLHGLALETGILFLPALALLLFEDRVGRGAFLHAGPTLTLLIIGAGPTVRPWRRSSPPSSRAGTAAAPFPPASRSSPEAAARSTPSRRARGSSRRILPIAASASAGCRTCSARWSSTRRSSMARRTRPARSPH